MNPPGRYQPSGISKRSSSTTKDWKAETASVIAWPRCFSSWPAGRRPLPIPLRPNRHRARCMDLLSVAWRRAACSLLGNGARHGVRVPDGRRRRRGSPASCDPLSCVQPLPKDPSSTPGVPCDGLAVLPSLVAHMRPTRKASGFTCHEAFISSAPVLPDGSVRETIVWKHGLSPPGHPSRLAFNWHPKEPLQAAAGHSPLSGHREAYSQRAAFRDSWRSTSWHSHRVYVCQDRHGQHSSWAQPIGRACKLTRGQDGN